MANLISSIIKTGLLARETSIKKLLSGNKGCVEKVKRVVKLKHVYPKCLDGLENSGGDGVREALNLSREKGNLLDDISNKGSRRP